MAGSKQCCVSSVSYTSIKEDTFSESCVRRDVLITKKHKVMHTYLNFKPYILMKLSNSNTKLFYCYCNTMSQFLRVNIALPT